MAKVPKKRSLDIHVRLEDGSKGPLLARGYTRLVVGGRGPYVEINTDQLLHEQIEPQPGEEYRLEGEWREKVFYGWHRTKAGHRKLYEQFRYVGYADYIPGYFYISPEDVIYQGDLHVVVSKSVKKDESPLIDFDA